MFFLMLSISIAGSPSSWAGGAQEQDLPDLQGQRHQGRRLGRGHGVVVQLPAEPKMSFPVSSCGSFLLNNDCRVPRKKFERNKS